MRPCASVRVRSSRAAHARVLKFHIWIPHGKIVDARFFFVCFLFFVFLLLFFFFFFFFVVVFLSELSPFLELCPYEKIRMKSDACHIL